MPLDFDFSQALEALGPNAPVRIANELRPPAEFVFNQILPERLQAGYVAESGSMTIRSTMAGLAAMDSPYPPGGRVEASDFMEQLAKLANEVVLSERAQRQLQDRLMRLQVNGGGTLEAMISETLNFTNKALMQPHFDTAEWMRGQALVNGEIEWTFNSKTLDVNYGVPTANFLTARTGTAGYGGTASEFWNDIRAIRRLLKYNLRMIVAHPETIDVIVNNPVNNLAITSQDGFNMSVQRLIAGVGGGQTASTDARDRVTFVSYDREGEMIDPTDTDGPLIQVPFMPLGKLLAVANNQRGGYRVGEGSTPDPARDRSLGYTHVGPTIEARGGLGRWADVFVPERKRYQLVGQAVTNLLPVIEAPDKIVVATTEMPA